jgi:flagellar motor switch protein FliG
MDDEGLERSAILLLSLGEEGATEVFKHLGPRDVQKLGSAMSNLKNVTHEKIELALSTFRSSVEGKSSLGLNSREYLRTVLTNALGDDKAGNLIDRITEGGENSGIEGLKWMDAATVTELISNEHPQIIATILVHLERDQAGEVLKLLPELVRNDVVLRIATLDGIQPSAMRELNDMLTKLLSGSKNMKKSPLGGVRAAAEILNFIPGDIESKVIDSVREYDAELSQKIQDEMFVFGNIIDIDDRGIQLLLREIQSESLIVALKGASQELSDKIFKNMSQRAAEMLRDDLDSKGPVRLSEVEAEQKEILKIARRLAEEGQLVLGGKGDDSYV